MKKRRKKNSATRKPSMCIWLVVTVKWLKCTICYLPNSFLCFLMHPTLGFHPKTSLHLTKKTIESAMLELFDFLIILFTLIHLQELLACVLIKKNEPISRSTIHTSAVKHITGSSCSLQFQFNELTMPP